MLTVGSAVQIILVHPIDSELVCRSRRDDGRHEDQKGHKTYESHRKIVPKHFENFPCFVEHIYSM